MSCSARINPNSLRIIVPTRQNVPTSSVEERPFEGRDADTEMMRASAPAFLADAVVQLSTKKIIFSIWRLPC